MKRTAIILAMIVSTSAIAQPDPVNEMDHAGKKTNDMETQKCMNMKDMDAEKCKTMMSGSDKTYVVKNTQTQTHKVTGVVKEFDAAKGKVMLDHQAVKSLNWPAMTMGFTVKDKGLFTKLSAGKNVDVEVRKEGTEYVVVGVK
jgi:Cu/Ag efflux protein CusF